MTSKLFMKISCLAAYLLLSLSLSAESMDHSTMHHEEHEAMQHSSGEHHAASNGMAKEPAAMAKLQIMPLSGKSREAGYDNRYVMESTTAEAAIATQCAQASRGLIMVDNATWAKCGGKPEGWSKGIGDKATTVSPMEHGQHMGH